MKRDQTILITIALIVIGVALFTLLSLPKAIDEYEANQLEYCRHVAAGDWPDFNKNYEEVCRGQK